MAINLSDNILAKTTGPADAKYGPYISSSLTGATQAALNFLDNTWRYEGLTVGLKVGSDDIIEYWFVGGISNVNLVPKPTAGTSGSSGINGTSGSSGISGTNGTSGSSGLSLIHI